jgi:hypothetical protein
MKTNILMTTVFLIFSLSSGYAKTRGQDKKADKAEKRLELQKQVESIIDSKQFIFVATRALPMWGTSIYLTANSNYLKFDPSSIESYMPFFGDTYSAEYNVDPGVHFAGKPEQFEIKKLNKDKGFDIRVEVSLPKDTYNIFVHVSLDGNANMTISSYNRSSISYVGSIESLAQPEQPLPKDKGNAI